MGVAECWVAEYLAAAGALKRAYMSNFMFEGFGRCRRFSEAVEAGQIATEDHSHYGMVCRFQVAGLGLPFMPMRAMAGSDIIETPGFEDAAAKSRRMKSPFGNGTLTAVSPLRPDVAIIHAARADLEGNVKLFGATSVVEEQARAASYVIVSVEEIVPPEVIRRHPELTILPSLLVDALVQLALRRASHRSLRLLRARCSAPQRILHSVSNSNHGERLFTSLGLRSERSLVLSGYDRHVVAVAASALSCAWLEIGDEAS